MNRSAHGANHPLFGGVKTEPHKEPRLNQAVTGAQLMSGAQCNKTVDDQLKNEPHAPTQHDVYAPTRVGGKSEFTGENGNPGNYFGQFAYPPQRNHPEQQNSQWLIPNGMIDACPAFTANLYQNWCREVKLWRQAQVGANETQIIAKIVATLPTNSRMEVLAYLENTESAPHTQSVEKVMEILNHRFGRTDTERAWSWLTSFAEFKRDGAENYKDFWTRFTRCVTRLQDRGLAMSESAVFHRAIQALRVPEGQLPILLATLETFPNPTSIDALKSLTIKMYETHRGKTDSSEVYTVTNREGEVGVESDTEGAEMQFADDSGEIFLLRPKKAAKSRNKPGNAETSKQGSVSNFQGTPNGPKPALVCIRLGDPGHFAKEFPHP